MTARVAINGFGRIGRLVLRAAFEAGRKDIEFVAINDLADVNIDADLIVLEDEGMVELANGCICCSLNTDFIDAVFRIMGRRSDLAYLVVETTGVADPFPVALTFLRTELRDLVRLDSIVTVVDAENFALERFESAAVRSQLVYGDVVLLNKCDLVGGRRWE